MIFGKCYIPSAIALSVFLLAISASARCMDPSPRLVCAEYFQSGAVVIAELLRSKHVSTEDDDYFLYTMRTERALRGRIPAVFKMVDEAGTMRALVPEKKRERFLLFLSYEKTYGAWAADNCGSSGPVSEATDILKAIDQLRGRTGGTVQGVVWLDPGATISVHGKQGTFTATTNDKGEFEVHVPAAGRYSVSVAHKGKQFESDVLSYEDPKNLRVMDGGCGQVQFNLVEEK
jgi:hypothetical protein